MWCITALVLTLNYLCRKVVLFHTDGLGFGFYLWSDDLLFIIAFFVGFLVATVAIPPMFSIESIPLKSHLLYS